MTHRERLLAALSHQQPDTVPLDVGGTTNSSIVVKGYEKLKEHFGITAETRVSHRMMQTVFVDEDILRALDIDTRAVSMGKLTKTEVKELAPNRYRDVWGVERIKPEYSHYYDIVTPHPLAGDITISDLKKYPWPDPDDPGVVAGIKDRVAWIRENTDCAVVLTIPSPIVHPTQYLRGFEDWYCDFVVNPDLLEFLFDTVLDVNTQIAANVLREAGELVDVVNCGDDLGAQQGLQMSYEHYSKFIKPRHAKYFRLVHDLTPAKLLFHSCGSVASIIEDLIEIGIDVLNPFQVSAAGMDPLTLKQKYRGRMAFWGGIDSQRLLPQGSVAEVEKMVETMIEQMGEGGGYVLSAVHNIQPDVPVENILAMFRHAREYVPSFARA